MSSFPFFFSWKDLDIVKWSGIIIIILETKFSGGIH